MLALCASLLPFAILLLLGVRSAGVTLLLSLAWLLLAKVSVQEHFFPVTLAYGSFAFSFALGLLMLAEKKLDMKLRLASLASSGLLAGASALAHSAEAHLFWAAWTLSQSLYVLAADCAFRLEKGLGHSIIQGQEHGLASFAPRVAQHFVIVILIWSATPGSLLFIWNDLVLSSIVENRLMLVLSFLLTNLVLSIAFWDLYSALFYGPIPASMTGQRQPAMEHGLWKSRLVLFGCLALGIWPAWVL